MVETYNMIDPFRDKYPTLKRYTWRKKTPLKQARLDYFLISANLMQYVKKCNIDMSYRPDHFVITLEFQFDDIKYESRIGNTIILYSLTKNILISSIRYKKNKRQYAIPIYNLEEIEKIPDQEIQFTINDQLFFRCLTDGIKGQSDFIFK